MRDDHIRAFVTDLYGNPLAELAQSAEQGPFRAFSPVWEVGGNGGGSLEYRLDNNPALDAYPELLSPEIEGTSSPNLVWMVCRGRTCVWIPTSDRRKIGRGEAAGKWAGVSGVGVRRLLYHRLVRPAALAAGNYDESTWTATSTYHVVASEHAGTILANLITASNARFATQITIGTIETDAADNTDMWEGNLRFESIGQVVDAFERAGFGRAFVTGVIGADGFGLRFDWFRNAAVAGAGGIDASGIIGAGVAQLTKVPDIFTGAKLPITFEEGADLVALDYGRNAGDALNHLYGESSDSTSGPVYMVPPEVADLDLYGPGLFPTQPAMRVEGYFRSPDTGGGFMPGILNETLNRGTKHELAIEVFESVGRVALVDYREGDFVGVRAPSARVDCGSQIRSLQLTQEGDKLRIGIALGSLPLGELGKVSGIGEEAKAAADAAARKPTT